MTDPIVARWADAERILDDVLDLPVEARGARALALCGDDRELAAVVKRLLDASSSEALPPAHAFVQQALGAGGAGPDVPATVGPFRILRELGRGGMGRVLLGIREDLVGAPQVALKVLDRPVDTPEARRRFARERETLARLAHPNIARLFDGGVTADGRPYLVMEYVDGQPIDHHCRHRGLDVEARLALLRQVCEAVAFAHGHLVIHRDLKPANVLVDVHGQVKLLDFGIAKWLDELEAESPLTLTAHRVLTPSHAAPEQFRGEAITAATDVYQLGLLLYGVLTGLRAHGSDHATPEALRKAVCDTEPVRPSAAIEAGAATTPGDRTLARRVAGDLDAIVLKALRKEPTERYLSVEALRADLDNYLEHRPVNARHGTGWYATRKYVRRHPTAAAVLVALLGGLGAVLWQVRVTAVERDRAVAAESAAAAVNNFLVNELLAAPTPERAQGRELTVAEVLSVASKGVEEALKGAPDVQAKVRETLARSYLALGKFDDAAAHATAAQRLVQRDDREAPDVLAVRRLLVEIAYARGEGTSIRQEAADVHEISARRLGAGHSETLRAADIYGRVLTRLDELTAAEALLADADEAAAAPATAFEARVAVRSAHIETLRARGKFMAAERLAREQVDWLTARFGPTHASLVPAGRQLSASLTGLLRYEEAVTAAQAQVTLHEQLYGPDHPATGQAVNDLAVAYDRAARDMEAGEASRRALGIYQRALGPDHIQTARALRNVAIGTRRAGRAAEALPMYQQVAEILTRTLGELNPQAIAALDELGNAFMDLGRVHDARALRLRIKSLYERAAARNDVDSSLLEDYAIFLVHAEPEDLRQPAKAVALAERIVGETERKNFEYLRALALVQQAAGQKAAALATAKDASDLPAGIQSFLTENIIVGLMRELEPSALEGWLLARLERLRRERGPDEYLLSLTLDHLAVWQVKQGRRAEAEATRHEQLDVLSRAVPPGHFMFSSVKRDLGKLLMDRGALHQAEPLLKEGFEGAVASRRFTVKSRQIARDWLVEVYEKLGRPDEAKKYRDYVLPTFSDR